MTTRIGIAGFGKMGRIRAAALRAEGAEIACVCDVAAEPEAGFRRAPSLDALIGDPAIDAVVVCLPNHLNKPVTMAALAQGKHVFCEKPPCFTAAEMREIIAAERASGRVLMYGFNHRQHEAIVRMKSIVESGTYGPILWMRGRYGKSVDAAYLETWRADKAKAGGGILMDQGIHMLDLFLYLAGAPFDEVQAMVSSLYWKIPGIEDNVFAQLRNSRTGLAVSFHSTMTQWRHLFSLEVFLERGYLVLNGLKTSSNTYGEEVLTVARNRTSAPAATFDDEERLHFKVDTSWQREARLFLDGIETGAPVTCGSSSQALAVMELIDRIYREKRHHGERLHSDLLAPHDD
ncbi:MAG TPA: Gfo/Idh/MocA family oxidoreductase [Stellaceae bacterium]|nr:Gfo/Idh/MocA family oxidoreductase [Stellaceae bacterium]